MRSIGLPLLHEEEVEGVVSSVFVDIRARMPFVPALFKALAADPDSLVAAWLQARMIYDDPRSPAAAPLRAGFRSADDGVSAFGRATGSARHWHRTQLSSPSCC